MVAVALRKQSTFEHPAQNREAVLARYHRLREISRMHHTKALDFLSKDAILHQTRRLGLAVGRTLCCDNMEGLTLAFDLTIHTASVGRSRESTAMLGRFSLPLAPMRRSCSKRYATRVSQSWRSNADIHPPVWSSPNCFERPNIGWSMRVLSIGRARYSVCDPVFCA